MDLTAACLYTLLTVTPSSIPSAIESSFIGNITSESIAPMVESFTASLATVILNITETVVSAVTGKSLALLKTSTAGDDLDASGFFVTMTALVQDDIKIVLFVALLVLMSGVGSSIADFPQLVTVLFNRDASGLSMTALCTKLFALSICFTKLLLLCLATDHDIFVSGKDNNNNNNNSGSATTNASFAAAPPVASLAAGTLQYLLTSSSSSVDWENQFTKLYFGQAGANQQYDLLQLWYPFLLFVATCGACCAMIQSLLLLLSISVFNPNSAKWPKFSVAVWAMSGLCSFIMLLYPTSNSVQTHHRFLAARAEGSCDFITNSMPVPEPLNWISSPFTADPCISSLLASIRRALCWIQYLRLFRGASVASSLCCYFSFVVEVASSSINGILVLQDFVIVIIEYFAFVCCMLSPVWFWYFNYKHKETKRFSKISQILHSFFAACGVSLTMFCILAMQQVGENAAMKTVLISTLIAGGWHLVFHVAMVLQVVASDRAAAIMNQKLKLLAKRG